jgi:hypothetical protein
MQAAISHLSCRLSLAKPSLIIRSSRSVREDSISSISLSVLGTCSSSHAACVSRLILLTDDPANKKLLVQTGRAVVKSAIEKFGEGK